MSDHTEPARCGNCRYAGETQSVEHVQCHYGTPTPQIIMGPQGAVLLTPYPWPMMNVSADWCAKHEHGTMQRMPRIVRLPAGSAAGLKVVPK